MILNDSLFILNLSVDTNSTLENQWEPTHNDAGFCDLHPPGQGLK